MSARNYEILRRRKLSKDGINDTESIEKETAEII